MASLAEESGPGLALCMTSEGYADAQPDGSCVSYWDNSGCVWTCGFGSTGADVVPGTQWTRQQAEDRLLTGWMSARAGVLRASPTLASPAMANWLEALTDFAYNEGVGRYQGSSLRAYVDRNDLTSALKEFPKWNLSGGKVLPGLVTRRAKEQLLAARPINGPLQSPVPADLYSPSTVSASSAQGLGPLLLAFFRSLFG
jgi:lysozyme